MPTIRALIVDDDPITRTVVSQCLAGDPDIEVVCCDSGDQAFARLNNGEKIDWLLLDWNMPGMSGHQFLCALRADARFNSLRIMMLTCQSSLDDVKQALAAGADEYLMKPFTKEMLIAKLALLALT
jgi:two-component system chemotaxis response regulator CheY